MSTDYKYYINTTSSSYTITDKYFICEPITYYKNKENGLNYVTKRDLLRSLIKLAIQPSVGSIITNLFCVEFLKDNWWEPNFK